MKLDDRTPIIVGVGEASERIEDADYSAASPAELAARAARAACEDAGSAGLAAHIDILAGIRQFEISHPSAVAPFGRADNLPRAIARRIGADPARAILEITGGQGPQYQVNQLAHAIADGSSDMALIAGAEAISTVRHLLSRGETRDWSETVGGQLEDRGYAVDGRAGEALVRHGAIRPLPIYAMFENARRERLGLDREAYRLEMGRLFAPFTQVAAGNPHAMSRQVFTPEDLASVTPANRIVCDPYPRRVVSRDQANQGAAVLLTCVGKARALGISADRWMFLLGGSDVKERVVIERPNLSRSPAAVAAIRQALAGAGLAMEDVSKLDLYSCFPIAVFNICDAFGLAADDARGLTVTGGLPFFGGAGNNYSMHAIASMVRALRETPNQVGLVGANGGYMTKYSVGLYGAKPAPWRGFDSQGLQASLDAAPAPPLIDGYAGTSRLESYTIDHAARAPRAMVVSIAGDDRRRLVAATEDAEIVRQMIDHDPLGCAIETTTDGAGKNEIVALG